jgi:acyl-CoA synthetase (AMP-forming)/AMP-acid ligase II
MPDSDFARLVEAAVTEIEGVTAAVAVPWRRPIPMRGTHLADVPRGLPATDALPPSPATMSGTVDNGAARPLAWLDGGAADLSADFPKTLREALERAASVAPDRGITFLSPEDGAERLTYAELLEAAQRALGGFRANGAQQGDDIIFQFTSNRAFVTAFWACVLGGFLPAPVALVVDPRGGPGAGKLRNTWEFLGRPMVVTDVPDLENALCDVWGADVTVVDVRALLGGECATSFFESTPDSPVLNLFTSGSTGMPKCVRHNNSSIVARTFGDITVNGLTADEVTLCSMPMDHVMGCVMAHTRDVFLGCEQVNSTPEMFAARPLDWLGWVDRHRVTNFAAPNFAFALLLEQSRAIAEGCWDLSTLRTVYNAGEPVNPDTVHAFLRALAPHGLPDDAMVASWGMSETSSTVTHTRLSGVDTTRGVVAVDNGSLAGDLQFAVKGTAVRFTDVGGPLPGVRVRVVDTTGEVVPEGRIGALEITGATMMSGYHANREANAETRTSDGWFRTGDLAFAWRGGLFIAGRAKDLIIVNGINHLSHDVESVVCGVPGVAPASAAACGVFDSHRGTDRLVLFYVPGSAGSDQREVVRAVRSAVATRTGLDPHAVVPIGAADFPRTASGKIQRAKLAERYRAGEFDALLRDMEVADEGPAVLPAWFFAPAWADRPVPDARPRGVHVVVADEPVGSAFAARVDGPVIVASPAAPYSDVLATAIRAHGHIDAVVHAVSLSCSDDDFERAVVSVVRLVRAMAGNGLSGSDLVVLGRLDTAVGGALTGLVRTIADERPVRSARLVLTDSDDPARWWGNTDVVAAHRRGTRQVPVLAPVPVPALDRLAFAPGGLLLVTGGGGGIGQLLGHHLSRAHDAKVLLTGRNPDGPADTAEVKYAQCDVTDPEALRAVVAVAELEWGRRLTGVLHLAGASLQAQWDDLDAHRVARTSPEAFEAALHAKVRGALALEPLLADRPDADVVLFSSVNGWFGGAGFGAYSTANGFLDGLAARWVARGRSVQSLAWSQWSGVGMNVGAPTAAAATARGFRPVSVERGLASITVARAIDAPHVVIGLDPANPVVSGFLAEHATVPVAIVAFTGDERRRDEVTAAASRAAGVSAEAAHFAVLPAFDGPALARLVTAGRGVVEPPQPGLEARIAEIWRDVLGHAEIGRDQSFFELGGSSLLTARVQERMAKLLGIRLKLRDFYSSPTIGGIARIAAVG